MTLQQLEYIIAVEQHGYFVNAADVCGVTQSTLSLMIKKLEEELDIKIFNRDTHPVTVTEMGRKVIDEAKMAIYHTKQLVELTRTEKEQSSGDLSIALTTTVAPVIMPGLFHYMRTKYPSINLRVEEMITATIIEKVKKAEIDMGILIQITDENGGITVVPESHLHLLPETAKDRIKPIVNPVPERTIGLAFRKDYVHERMMNIVIKAIKPMVPSEFLDGVIRTDYLRL